MEDLVKQPDPDFIRAQALIARRFGESTGFTVDDPYHALRSAAHALHDFGVLSDAMHTSIVWELIK
jgi:hypothetical protein